MIYQKDGLPHISVNDLYNMAGKFTIIDVRRPDEFVGDLGHIDGAKLVTIDENFEQALATLKPKDPIVFICRSGMRSAKATEMALALKFESVCNMEGGMIRWNEKNYPVVR